MSKVEFKDFSFNVKAALNDTTIAWLHEWANEITSHAQRTTSKEGWSSSERTQLRDNYKNVVNASKGEARIGNSLEASYWEEWGTGEYAAHGDGRKGWWVFVKGQESKGGGKTYNTKEEAEEAAAYLRSAKKLDAYATNGRRPNYTLEKAFKENHQKAKDDLERKLKGRME